MSFEYSQEVANDHGKLFETKKGYDVIIYAGENENLQEIHAHSLILCTRSQYFRTEFSKNLVEKKDGKFIFKKPEISPEYFEIILRFIYCGKIDLTNLQGPKILKLLIVVDELNIQTLIPCIQEYLIKHQYEFLKENSMEVLEAIYQHESFKDLRNFSLEEICEDSEILFNSDKFVNLNASLLELLLERDDLALEEIFIWDSLIKWCLAQHSNISQDVNKWSKDDITTMERTIHKFIPLIRFYNLSPEDFISKVFPFKALLPDDLISNIFTFHMAPNKQLDVNIQPSRKPKLKFSDSVIINNEHLAIFSNWIEKKKDSHYNVKNIPYNFNLLYRSSRDGNTAATFHEKCDNMGATIVMVKIKDSEKIVGGYNPLFWDSCYSYKSTKDSFMFSFTDRTNLQTAKVSYSSGDNYSVGGYLNYGPIFGHGANLGFNNLEWYSNQAGFDSSYYELGRLGIPEGKFDVDDYEVFQIVKKK